jgi:hypothetical protein
MAHNKDQQVGFAPPRIIQVWGATHGEISSRSPEWASAEVIYTEGSIETDFWCLTDDGRIWSWSVDEDTWIEEPAFNKNFKEAE